MCTFYFHQQSCVDFIFHQQSLDYYQLVIILMKPEFPERNHRPAASHCDKLYYIEITLVLLPIDNQLISLKVYFLRNQSYRDKSENQKQYLNCWTFLHKVLEIRTRIIRVIVSGGATCLSADCCFSELALYKSNSVCWSSTKRTSSSSHWKLTCSRYDIAEKLLNWR
jgi:hypothetical protein